MDRQLFEQMYQGKAPWDTGRPQPAIMGENALYLAGKGHESWGLDFVSVAVERAKAKAVQRGIDAHFLVGNALELARLGRRFDTVIDCGLFHTFRDEERPVFVEGLTEVLGPGGLLHILCFSNEEPGTEGPRRVSQLEIRDAFRNGWKVKQIEPTRFESVERPGGMAVSPGGPKAWLATIERT